MSAPKPKPNVLLRLLPFLRPEGATWALALVLAPVSAGLSVLQPWLLQQTVDQAIVPGDLAALSSWSGAYLGAALASFVTEALYVLVVASASLRAIHRLRSTTHLHILTRSATFFDQSTTGHLLTRVTSDVDALGETLSAGAFTILMDMALVLGLTALLFGLDARLALVLLLVAPPLALAIEAIRRQLRTLFAAVRNSLSELTSWTSERLEGVRVVQLYGDEGRALRGFDARLGAYRDATVRSNLWDALLFALVDGVSSMTMALLLAYGAWGPEGLATAGLLAAFLDAIGRLFQPIREFSAKLAVLQRATTAAEKIFSVLDDQRQISPGKHPAPDDFQALEVKGLRFDYGRGEEVLRGIDFQWRRGQVVAVVGRTGSGKSTLARLLLRQYDGYRGSITLDGVELRDFDPGGLARLFGQVPQDVVLFPGDLRFNLTLGRDLSDEVLHRALSLARAEGLAQRLGGLSGTIRHRGANLSVGEAQLLAIARCFAHDTPCVLLDEATASVDPLTEVALQEATAALLATRTVLVIAHRLSTIRHADLILVMDRGQVVEAGRHEELVAAAGVYAGLLHAAQGAEGSEGAIPS